MEPEEDGDDDADGFSELSRDELYERAQRAGVKGRSKMGRKQLIEALDGG